MQDVAQCHIIRRLFILKVHVRVLLVWLFIMLFISHYRIAIT